MINIAPSRLVSAPRAIAAVTSGWLPRGNRATSRATVVVISPNQVHNLRGRYGSAGNKDDRFDAFVLADTLRTDRARLRPLIPDTPTTVMLRSAVRARKDLPTHRVRRANQLRAHLRFFHPGPGCSPTSTP